MTVETVDEEKVEAARLPGGEHFDPNEHMRLLGGNAYLDVKFRIIAFRRDHPRGSIETFMMEHRPGEYAVFKCEVRIPHPDNPVDGRWIEEMDTRTTGWGSETLADFPAGYLEKGETKAIGRALAHIGYGTASLADDGDRPADAPVDQPAPRPQAQPRQVRQSRQPQAHEGRPMMRNPDGAATEAQINAIIKIAARKQVTDLDLIEYVEQTYANTLDTLTKGQASELIQKLGDQSFTGFGGAANGSPASGKSDDDLPLEKSAF